ncbi:MAG TPA: DNA mismatch repair protein MutS [Desulfobulbus sp.]|nr:DNA mismatch repair protein MutS [Desulfobulbus sp.]
MTHKGRKKKTASRRHETDHDQVIRLPINGILDLHAFAPGDIRHLVPDYLEECRRRDIRQVRIIHGKGTGALRRSVHAILARMDIVRSYRIAGPEAGSWGATLVELKKAP